MKQTIEIEVPDGKKAVWRNNQLIFENIELPKPKYPKTWKEFCKFYPIEQNSALIDRDSAILILGKRDNRCDYFDRNVLPSSKAAKQHLALMQLHQLRDCYRQGWKPNWNDENNKYYIAFFNSKNHCVSCTRYASKFLTFQSMEIAEEFLNNFRDLIEQAEDLI